MRVIANNVEYFDLVRDQVHLLGIEDQSTPGTPLIENINAELRNDHGLKDSLWFFDGTHVQCWMDVENLLESASTENDRELPQTVLISTDFYPSSIVLNKGIILGVDADLVQRRDVNFALFRLGIRVGAEICPQNFPLHAANTQSDSTLYTPNPPPLPLRTRPKRCNNSLQPVRASPVLSTCPRNPPIYSPRR